MYTVSHDDFCFLLAIEEKKIHNNDSVIRLRSAARVIYRARVRRYSTNSKDPTIYKVRFLNQAS